MDENIKSRLGKVAEDLRRAGMKSKIVDVEFFVIGEERNSTHRGERTTKFHGEPYAFDISTRT